MANQLNPIVVTNTLLKIDLQSQTVVASIGLSREVENGSGSAISGHYLYLPSSAGEIIKIDMNTFTEVAILDMPNWCMSISADDKYIFYGSYTGTTWQDSRDVLYRVDVNSFQQKDMLDLGPYEGINWAIIHKMQ